MFAGFNILGFIFNSRKWFLALGVVLIIGFGYWLFELRRDLVQSQKELMSCENSKAVEVFVTENSSVFNNYRERIKEMEDEEFNISSSSNVNFDWMYR